MLVAVVVSTEGLLLYKAVVVNNLNPVLAKAVVAEAVAPDLNCTYLVLSNNVAPVKSSTVTTIPLLIVLLSDGSTVVP